MSCVASIVVVVVGTRALFPSTTRIGLRSTHSAVYVVMGITHWRWQERRRAATVLDVDSCPGHLRQCERHFHSKYSVLS
jgi:hypothetical protein